MKNLRLRWSKKHNAIRNLSKIKESSEPPIQHPRRVLPRNSTATTTLTPNKKRCNSRSRVQRRQNQQQSSSSSSPPPQPAPAPKQIQNETSTVSKASLDGMRGRFIRERNRNQQLEEELLDLKMEIATLKMQLINKKSTEYLIEKLLRNITVENECIRITYNNKYVFCFSKK